MVFSLLTHTPPWVLAPIILITFHGAAQYRELGMIVWFPLVWISPWPKWRTIHICKDYVTWNCVSDWIYLALWSKIRLFGIPLALLMHAWMNTVQCPDLAQWPDSSNPFLSALCIMITRNKTQGKGCVSQQADLDAQCQGTSLSSEEEDVRFKLAPEEALGDPQTQEKLKATVRAGNHDSLKVVYSLRDEVGSLRSALTDRDATSLPCGTRSKCSRITTTHWSSTPSAMSAP